MQRSYTYTDKTSLSKRSLVAWSLIIFTFFLGDISAQSTCSNALVLCNPNASFAAATTGANLGAIPTCAGTFEQNNCSWCTLQSAPRPAFYVFTVTKSGDLYMNINTSPQRDVDFALWGPFTSTNMSTICGPNGYPSGFPIDCDYSNATSESIDVPNVISGQIYVLMITNYSGQSTNITLAPRAENSALLGGPFAFDGSQNTVFGLTDPPVNLSTIPSNGTASTNVTFSGPGITNATQGTFNPAIAGFGTHTISANGMSNGCSVSRTLVVQVLRDSDGDGINDVLDQDDDNDGILDVIEICGSLTGNILVQVKVKADSYGSETTWRLEDASTGTVVASGGPYANNQQNTYTTNHTVPSANYTFKIFDAYGDGICCRYGSGYYEISVNGKSIIGGMNSGIGGFQFQNVHSIPKPTFFCLSSDPSLDDDGDGILNYMDANFCTSLVNGVCADLDLDGDGIINSMDPDADGDGCPDVFEAGFPDLDMNGQLDGSSFNTNGLVTGNSEGYSGTMPMVSDPLMNPCSDIDEDGIPDIIDIDDDGDGIPDIVECPTPIDTDGDGLINSRDIDSDGDGIPDIVEAQPTNGFIMPTGIDSDGDGLDNAFDSNCISCPGPLGITLVPYNFDQGSDTKPDYIDTDSDQDNTSDRTEAWDFNGDGSPETVPLGIDRDRDGLDDGFDLDTSNFNVFGPSNGGMRAQDLPNHDGVGEPDFRDAFTTLPIELLAFDAEAESSDRVLLTWVTAAEVNNNFFTIERSLDAQEWTEVRNIPGAGNSSSILMYETYDSEPYSGISYYRLKQTDFDGQFSYSPIRAVQMDEMAKVEVFPNPTNSFLNVFVGESENVSLKLIDSAGREMDPVVENFGAIHQIHVSGMAPGTYLLSIDNGKEIDVQIVVIY